MNKIRLCGLSPGDSIYEANLATNTVRELVFLYSRQGVYGFNIGDSLELLDQDDIYDYQTSPEYSVLEGPVFKSKTQAEKFLKDKLNE